MTRRLSVPFFVLAVAALAFSGCADDSDSTAPPSSTPTSTAAPSTTATPTTTTPTTTVMPSTSTSASPTTTVTTAPTPVCSPDDVLDVVADAIATARLAETTEWSGDPAASPFVERTTTGEEYAARLGLECGTLFADDTLGRQRLAIVGWTGPRVAFAIQATDAPSTPYRADALVRNHVSDDAGEWLEDDMSLWSVTDPDGNSVVLGHVDFSLGAAAKDWDGIPRVPIVNEINVPAEQHALDALNEAGMYNPGIAQPPEFGSEEGYVQFVSLTGQISVADVAPTGWFDPMRPRYYLGETTIRDIDGVDVRVTLPNPDDNLGFVLAAEVAFACDEFVWILEPPFNGTIEEMIDVATAVINTEECQS